MILFSPIPTSILHSFHLNLTMILFCSTVTLTLKQFYPRPNRNAQSIHMHLLSNSKTVYMQLLERKLFISSRTKFACATTSANQLPLSPSLLPHAHSPPQERTSCHTCCIYQRAAAGLPEVQKDEKLNPPCNRKNRLSDAASLPGDGITAHNCTTCQLCCIYMIMLEPCK